ncbi:MAG: biotin transporter BioY [Methanoregulaceae archaeon]|nr:biotin transporter BioY [Methanoregulaceae archaeon]
MFGDRERALLITETAAFAGLIAAGSWISIPFFPVPFTLQTLFVLLAGAVMRRFAVYPVALYLVAGSLGMPVFHGGTAGIGVLLGPTGGYLAGFLPAAAVAGLGYGGDSEIRRITALIGATAVIYSFGVAWLALSGPLPWEEAILLGVLPFLPGDAVKLAAAHTIAARIIPEHPP